MLEHDPEKHALGLDPRDHAQTENHSPRDKRGNAALPRPLAFTTNGSMGKITDKDRVLAANDAFYAALRDSDFTAMDGLWSQRREVAVYHPNWRGIDGRDAVMESWYRILVLGAPPPIRVVDPTVIVSRGTALVICHEEIDGTLLIATNVFIREDGGWRMTHHQASPLPKAADRTGRRSQSG